MSDERKRTQVADVDRSLYDFTKSEEGYERYDDGLTPEIVRAISEKKDEPEWMLEMRLSALEEYHRRPMAPNWGPSIAGLDLDHISTYVSPKTKQAKSWDDVPEDIKDTFERLGIPEAERESLAGVGAPVRLGDRLPQHARGGGRAGRGLHHDRGRPARPLRGSRWCREHFGTLIPPARPQVRRAALRRVERRQSFVYVPAGVTLPYPLQSYVRLNAAGAGQFEHTLIILEPGADLHFIEGCSAPKYYEANLHAGAVELFVKDGARLRYSTIENWSKNMYNLNTKRATIGAGRQDGVGLRQLWQPRELPLPTTIMAGDRGSCEFTGITFAGATQDLDTGCKTVLMNAPDTTRVRRARQVASPRTGGVHDVPQLRRGRPSAPTARAAP